MADQQTEINALRDVQDRLFRAADRLDSLASQEDVGTPERSRLRGKREGVLLAESYLAEVLRSQHNPPETPGPGDPGAVWFETPDDATYPPVLLGGEDRG